MVFLIVIFVNPFIIACMKTVKFYIQKLGAIKNSSIELSPLMIFSGESGLGKSYVSFLAHYLYILLTTDRISSFFKENDYDFDKLLIDKKDKAVILKINIQEFLEWVNRDAISYIGYLLGYTSFEGAIKIELPIDKASLSYQFEEEIMGLNNSEEVFYKVMLESFIYRVPSTQGHYGTDPFVSLLKAVLSNSIFSDYRFVKKTFLMPTSRGSLVELNSRPPFSSGMYEEFFDNKEELERPSKETNNDISIDLFERLSEINVGDIQRVDGKMIYFTNGVQMPVTAAASSIKELAPLTLFFKKYPAKGASILFEEPEAHLHPARQARVADLVGCAISLGCHMQITTHSDYFIRRLNSLISLYKLKEKDSQVFKDICHKFGFKESDIINPQDVKAYVLKRRGDGSTEIVEQSIDEEGIPFDSFHEVISNDIISYRTIQNALG